MSQQDSESGPESVLIRNPWGPWTQVGDDDPLARLHERFWGKGIAEEEEEWLKDQGKPPFDSLDDESDIGPGCCVLNIGMEGCPKLWVRSDYIRMYDFCNDIYGRPWSPYAMTPLVVITGQPGISQCFAASSGSYQPRPEGRRSSEAVTNAWVSSDGNKWHHRSGTSVLVVGVVAKVIHADIFTSDPELWAVFHADIQDVASWTDITLVI